MAGTIKGGQLAGKTNKDRHGDDFYRLIGAKGGRAKFPGKGFAGNLELARKAGKIGGKTSRIKGVKNVKQETN